MQLNLNTPTTVTIIRGVRPTADGYAIHVGERVFDRSAILTPDSAELWDVGGYAGLTAAHFEALAELNMEVVVLGTGDRIRFPDPALTRSLTDRQIGLEVMDTPAACRTYNILAGDGRRVVAALINEASSGPDQT